MPTFSRRRFLGSATTLLGAASLGSLKPARFGAEAAKLAPTVLRVERRIIEVLGRPATVYGLTQPDGRPGVVTAAGTAFQVHLENRTNTPTLIHWHGLLPPYGQDGVPDLPQPLLPGGASYDYDFPLETPGTHWMHAHTLQEQDLLAAPLIVEDPAEAGLDERPVVVVLHDFSFRTPEEILAGLTRGGGMVDMGGHGMAGEGAMAMDVNDVAYDAYLANDRTLDDPEVFRVEPGGRIRLRLINGATATAFWIDLGALAGEAIAVDGNPIRPVNGSRFPLGMGQRIDIRLRLPNAQGAWPILALREGAIERTGFILATRRAPVHRVEGRGRAATHPLDLAFEARLVAERPLVERSAERSGVVALDGDMTRYAWTLDGQVWGRHRPLPVVPGERVEVIMRNRSMMGHPMHLHGHRFQVVGVNGQRIAGAMRDTVWIPSGAGLAIAFDASNPGVWAFHCHHLYHMATGMMTTVEYGV